MLAFFVCSAEIQEIDSRLLLQHYLATLFPQKITTDDDDTPS